MRALDCAATGTGGILFNRKDVTINRDKRDKWQWGGGPIFDSRQGQVIFLSPRVGRLCEAPGLLIRDNGGAFLGIEAAGA